MVNLLMCGVALGTGTKSGCLTAAHIALFDAQQWVRTAVRIIENRLNERAIAADGAFTVTVVFECHMNVRCTRGE
jgi:hypothetical protein